MIWIDESLDERVRALALVNAASKRSAAKRLGRWLDSPVGESLRAAVVAIAQERGVCPDESWSGKRLLRLAGGREEAARVRSNPIRRDEAFVCVHCGESVPAHGRTARDHCPFCLRSVHVDVVPGDRAETCGGLLEPVAAVVRSGGEEILLSYRCRRCGVTKKNRVMRDGDPPDAMDVVARLPGPS